MTNRLSQETSPYLLQHQNNPVDWYPWGPEALNKAKEEDKPILLSVGYSACHWCHVMEHESFENPSIAQLMNENFINIKVDREERPDIDQIYQNVAQAMQQGGGWPLTVFLTPDLRPFYGGTYFPPEDRYGRPGFPRVLSALSQAYRTDRSSVTEQGEKISAFIAANEKLKPRENVALAVPAITDAASRLIEHMDWTHGGMAGSPKFPNPSLLGFLWRFGFSSKDEKMKQAVLLTLRQMAMGGIYDQLGGGFHRYSVDETWSVPHFEKMLYDNALLLKIYSEVLLSERENLSPEDRKLFVEILEGTVQYVLREMTSPEGGFYSAQDADSEGEEGKFFVWDFEDLKSHLELAEAEIFAKTFGVSKSGNFEHGKTVLFRASVPEPAEMGPLANAKRKLLEARAKRVPPGLDHKILISWNGLMISGLSWASLALGNLGSKEIAESAVAAARRAWNWVTHTAQISPGRLACTIQKIKPRGNGYLDDYAFMISAALDLARVENSDEKSENYFKTAKCWVQSVLSHFKDPNEAGYFFTSDDHEVLIHRPKTVFDQAIPSGTAVFLSGVQALIELGQGESTWELELERQISALFPSAVANPYGCAELLAAALMRVVGPVSVSFADSEDSKDSALLMRNSLVYRKPVGEKQPQGILICHKQACFAPETSVEGAWRKVLELIQIIK